jgi:ankyrin repeat protein
MFAAAEGQLEVVRVLLKFGADPSAVDKDGDVAADHAVSNRHSEVEGVLREALR